jgi:hypothetical protein
LIFKNHFGFTFGVGLNHFRTIARPEISILDTQLFRMEDRVPIRSEQEALEYLQSGWFSEPWGWRNRRDLHVTIRDMELEYRIDTKGFYQPVYVFSVSVDGSMLPGGLLVPALP